MIKTFNIEISHGQLAVFRTAMYNPFNDWTDKHVSQGFSWRPGSVSFRTIADAGLLSIELEIVDRMGNISPSATRVIEVPFHVPADGVVEIGGIVETATVSLPAGDFLLRCELFDPAVDNSARARLVFAATDALSANLFATSGSLLDAKIMKRGLST